jgi:hypothetical protein
LKHSGFPTALHTAVHPPLKENTAVFQPLYSLSFKYSGLPTALHTAVLPPPKENTAVFQPLYRSSFKHSGHPTARIFMEKSGPLTACGIVHEINQRSSYPSNIYMPLYNIYIYIYIPPLFL